MNDTTMPEMPVRITTPDTTDRRLISEMRFGVNYSPAETLRDGNGNIVSKQWEPTPDQQQEEKWVREYLAACGCVYACDIETLGCTGVAKLTGVTWGEAGAYAITNGTRLRLGLGGGGVGLPCFVPPNLFCLIHNTVGGLQDHQQALHPEYVSMISRELTPQECIQLGLTDKARRMRGGERTVDALNVLTGQNEDAVAEVAESLEDAHDEKVLEAVDAEDSESVPFVPLGVIQTWKCTEHTETDWACRHCLAQAVVEGPLVPRTIVGAHARVGDDGHLVIPISSEYRPAGGLTLDPPVSVEAVLKEVGGNPIGPGAVLADVWVRVAVFSRKFSRD